MKLLVAAASSRDCNSEKVCMEDMRREWRAEGESKQHFQPVFAQEGLQLFAQS